MAIKKKMTVVDWREIFNSNILEATLLSGRKKYKFHFTNDDEKKQVNRIIGSIDVRCLESNFKESEKVSHFRPIHDPYGWLRETQHFDEATNYVLSFLLPESLYFNPSFDWIFKGYLYELTGQHKNSSVFTEDHVSLLILENYDKDRKKFERLQSLYGSSTDGTGSIKRPNIPERVRIEVWRRDSGKCVKCGSREKLEYDHIIPISKGGSNTARNIELLCEKCNRSKSNKIE